MNPGPPPLAAPCPLHPPTKPPFFQQTPAPLPFLRENAAPYLRLASPFRKKPTCTRLARPFPQECTSASPAASAFQVTRREATWTAGAGAVDSLRSRSFFPFPRRRFLYLFAGSVARMRSEDSKPGALFLCVCVRARGWRCKMTFF